MVYQKTWGRWRKSTILSRRIKCLIRATKKNPQFTAKDLQDYLMKGRKEKNISTQSIRRTLDKHGFHIGTSCRMPLLTKKNIKGKLVETCGVLEECFMEWCDQTGTFWPMDQEYVWCKTGKPYEQKNTISMVKHGGGPVLLWGCFAVAGNGNRDCMKNIMDSLEYQAILAMIRMSSVQRLKLDVHRTAIPKYTSKSTYVLFRDWS